jgi:hypothetical protein
MKPKIAPTTVHHVGTDIANIVETTKDALTSRKPSRHATEARKQAAKVAVTSLFAAGLGIIAIRSAARLKRAAKDHQNWEQMDAKLDVSLEHAGNTSEPTAMY